VQLPAEKALATGLIINELITNAFKYAFADDRPGIIKVNLSQANTDYVLTVTDTGIGCAKERKSGLGTRLVTVFAAQLGGTASWDSLPEGGCHATMRFPVH
jgi:two-component sensor histidine kinase